MVNFFSSRAASGDPCDYTGDLKNGLSLCSSTLQACVCVSQDLMS